MASFLWTIISKQGPLTKLVYNNTVFQENNAFDIFTCFPFFPAVIKHHIFTALLFPNLHADEGKGRVPDGLAAVLGPHRGDAASPGDTSQNERQSGVATLEGVESAVPGCPREAEKPGSAQRGGFLANWVR